MMHDSEIFRNKCVKWHQVYLCKKKERKSYNRRKNRNSLTTTPHQVKNKETLLSDTSGHLLTRRSVVRSLPPPVCTPRYSTRFKFIHQSVSVCECCIKSSERVERCWTWISPFPILDIYSQRPKRQIYFNFFWQSVWLLCDHRTWWKLTQWHSESGAVSSVHSVHPSPYLSGSSAVYRFLSLPLVENISPPAAPSATPSEASCPGFAQPGCDLMPKPFLSPAGCSGSETKACNAMGIITLSVCIKHMSM